MTGKNHQKGIIHYHKQDTQAKAKRKTKRLGRLNEENQEIRLRVSQIHSINLANILQNKWVYKVRKQVLDDAHKT